MSDEFWWVKSQKGNPWPRAVSADVLAGKIFESNDVVLQRHELQPRDFDELSLDDLATIFPYKHPQESAEPMICLAQDLQKR